MEINVFKFGGASVSTGTGIENVGSILAEFTGAKTAVVVSATGKTTNMLEAVVHAFFYGQEDALALLEQIKANHLTIMKDLGLSAESVADVLDAFVEVEWLLDEGQPQDGYDYTYDQMVAVGELVSSKILHHFLVKSGLKAGWLDVRSVLFTDEIHREAKVNWDLTAPKMRAHYTEAFGEYDVIVTQGFIGSTTENHTTTLGREGSDYTAAILSYCLDAKAMHIWKDVPGVLTGDPRLFDNVSIIERLSYKEAIEMTYYGAKVIHPKTIKPLQNKNIPLFVRPFDDVKKPGTLIADHDFIQYPPIVVVESDQALVHISVKDFSFVAEHHLSRIFTILADLRIKTNMMRNTAISFSVCVQHSADKLKRLVTELGDEFTVVIDHGLELITVRHFQPNTVKSLKNNKVVLFEERLQNTIQMVVKEVPEITRKS